MYEMNFRRIENHEANRGLDEMGMDGGGYGQDEYNNAMRTLQERKEKAAGKTKVRGLDMTPFVEFLRENDYERFGLLPPGEAAQHLHRDRHGVRAVRVGLHGRGRVQPLHRDLVAIPRPLRGPKSGGSTLPSTIPFL